MQLTGGFTTNIIIKEGDFVTKTGKTAGDEAAWYAFYQDKKDIPQVLSANDLSLKMEYLERKRAVDLDLLIGIVEKYKHYPRINNLTFDAYVDRICFHVEQSGISNGYKLLDLLQYIKLEPTFAHGDLSIKNIIHTDEGVKLIDPLYFSNFGSYVLDYAKLAFTLKFYNGEFVAFDKIRDHVNVPFFDVLVASECMRVATYNRNFDFIAENLINEL